MHQPVRIGNYLVSSMSEQFRIFPKNKAGEAIPVRRINQFLYLHSVLSGKTTEFKRYLHQKKWYWRDSRDKNHCTESDVVNEVARMLFHGDKSQAQDLLLRAIMDHSLTNESK